MQLRSSGTSVQAADVYFDRTKSGEKVVVRVWEKFQFSRCFDVESQPSAFQCPLRWSHCLEALLTSKEHGSVSNTTNVRSIQLHAFCLVGFEAYATWPTFRLSSLWSGGVGSCCNVGGCETPSVRGICPMACPRAQSSCSGSVRTFWRWRSNTFAKAHVLFWHCLRRL